MLKNKSPTHLNLRRRQDYAVPRGHAVISPTATRSNRVVLVEAPLDSSRAGFILSITVNPDKVADVVDSVLACGYRANPLPAGYTYPRGQAFPVERITFYNSENGYTVLRLRPEGSRQQRVPGLSFDGTVLANH